MKEKILIAAASVVVAIIVIAILFAAYSAALYLMLHQPHITAAVAPAMILRWFYQECFTI